MAAPARKGRGAWTYRAPRGQTDRYIWGRLTSRGRTGQFPLGGELTGVLCRRYRESPTEWQQGGLEATVVPKSSNQRCNAWGWEFCIC